MGPGSECDAATPNAQLMIQSVSSLLHTAAVLAPPSTCGRAVPRRIFHSRDSEAPVVIDLRPSAEYEAGHLAGSASLPVASLQRLLYELPPPGEWPLTLIGAKDELATARDLLQPKGWDAVELDASDPATWACDGHVTQLEEGATSASTLRPNSFLASVLSSVEMPAAPGAAIDLGCGSGRDAVAMALRLGPAWRVLGLDNHGMALERAATLARDHATTAEFHDVNMRRPGFSCAELVEGAPVLLVHGCRFLHRPLLETLPALLAPGGLFVYSHFVDPDDGPPLAPPFRAGRRLTRGELRRTLGEAQGFEVLVDEVGEMLTRGLWVAAQFYAARRR